MSGPGPSSTRSRSFTSGPPPPGRDGGSVQARATRSCPLATASPAPAEPTTTGLATRKVCVCETCVLSIAGSAVAMSSQTRSPCAGCSQCDGPGGVLPAVHLIPLAGSTPPRRKASGQSDSGSTFVRTTRPYPCSLFPMIPTEIPAIVPRSVARVRRKTLSGVVLLPSPGVRMLVVNLAEATSAAFTRAPEMFGTRFAVTRSPPGYSPWAK